MKSLDFDKKDGCKKKEFLKNAFVLVNTFKYLNFY